MSLIETTLYGRVDKVQKAIDRIRAYEPISNGFMDTPFYVAYSGGKDSDALRILFELAGVPYDLVHNHTTVDAPETVQYIRTIPKIQISMPDITMWRLIEKKRMPPTRIARYCCEELKEHGGMGRFVATGVRWAESVKRQGRGSLEVVTAKAKNKVILNADNDENRRMFESCRIQGKRVLNPIIEWSEDDVWEFLHYYGCASNPLYQCGFKRVGCVGCPMNTNRKIAFEWYLKYKQMYIHAFDRMLIKRREDNLPIIGGCQSGESVFNWWVSEKEKLPETLEGQMTLWGIEE